jgi:C-terminal processing protease CtpA/Prc
MCLQFFEAIWDKAGTAVELEVVRANIDHPFHIKLTVEDVPKEKFNRYCFLLGINFI